MRTLSRGAGEAQRTLESAIASADERWPDSARRTFEADHLAAIRSEARLLRVELDAIATLAEQAMRELG